MKLSFKIPNFLVSIYEHGLTLWEVCAIILGVRSPVVGPVPVPASGYKDKTMYVIRYNHAGETRYYLADEPYPWTDNPDDATQYYSVMDASGTMQDFIDEWKVPVVRLKVMSLYDARREAAPTKDKVLPAVRITCDGRWVEVTQEAFIELMEQSGKCEAFDKINEKVDWVEE